MGYSRAVVKGGWCFVSGVTGYDYATMTMPDSIADQGRNCFATIAGVLAQGGFETADIVRVQYTVTDNGGGAGAVEFKTVQVTVSWTDAQGQARTYTAATRLQRLGASFSARLLS